MIRQLICGKCGLVLRDYETKKKIFRLILKPISIPKTLRTPKHILNYDLCKKCFKAVKCSVGANFK